MAPALTELAAVELRLGDLEGASKTCSRALDVAHRAGHRPTEAQALTVSAQVCLGRRQYDAARRQSEAAVLICRALGLRLSLARSLCVLGEAVWTAHGRDAGSPHASEAAAIFTELGVPETLR
jgi:hypothetical protein